MRLTGRLSMLASCAFASATVPLALAHPAIRVQTEQLSSSSQPAAQVTPSQPQTPPGPATQLRAAQIERAQPVSSGHPQLTGPSQGQSATEASEGVKLDPTQLRDLLHKVYMAAFRITDLLGILQTDKWKIDEAARRSFTQTVETARGQLKALEENRQKLLEKPENSDLADKTDATITALLPNIEAVAAAIAQYDSPAQGTQYKQPGDQLRALQNSLRPYVLYLHAKAEAALAPAAGLQIEVIQPSTTPPAVAIPADTSGPPPPLQPDQLKELLYKMYVSAFRIQDLLGQEQPEKWNASDKDRAGFNQARESLHARLAEFEKVRSQFAASPVSADLAFQTYRALTGLQEPLELVSRSVSAHGEAKLGDEYRQRSGELTAGQQELVPYISYFLNRWDRAMQMFQNNLAACENQLSYAMRSRREVAAPLPNVNPEFQGHARKKANSLHTSAVTAKKTQSKKSAKKSGKQASTLADQAKP